MVVEGLLVLTVGADPSFLRTEDEELLFEEDEVLLLVDDEELLDEDDEDVDPVEGFVVKLPVLPELLALGGGVPDVEPLFGSDVAVLPLVEKLPVPVDVVGCFTSVLFFGIVLVEVFPVDEYPL